MNMSSKYTLFWWIVTALSLVISFGLIRSIWEHRGRWTLVDRRKEVLVREQEKNSQLLEKLREATSSTFIEKEAREKLGLARPEDTIVLMAQPEGSASGDKENEATTNIQRWWRLFF